MCKFGTGKGPEDCITGHARPHGHWCHADKVVFVNNRITSIQTLREYYSRLYEKMGKSRNSALAGGGTNTEQTST
ncbi:hypothetical protein M3J09_005093 [Ascochyta lentis]